MMLLAVLTLLFFSVFGVVMARGNRAVVFLEDAPPLDAPDPPRVSIIIPALNEERNIEEALRSVLAQDYAALEFIVIDDRSTDRTGAILDAMAAADARLGVVHVTELPEGWLGKNNALQLGAARARGEILLFTDADIVMHPTAVRRAVGVMLAHGLDHLAALPQIAMSTFMTRIFVGAFGIFFTLFTKPWKARDPRSPRYIGIGAFNMVRREAYQASGTHAAIAMRPDDDLKLGKLIKRRGLRQEMVFGRGMLHVEWYASLGEAIRGLTKNTFAGVEYSIATVLGATVFQFLFFVWPFLGILLTHGWTRALNAAAAAAIVWICHDTARFHNGRSWYGLFFGISTLIFIYVMWRSMVLTLVNRGIDWRGTHYPLEKLKANRV